MPRPPDGLSAFAGVSLATGVSGPLTRIRFLLGGLEANSRPPPTSAGDVATVAASGAGGLLLIGAIGLETRAGDPSTGGNVFSKDLKPLTGDCGAVASAGEPWADLVAGDEPSTDLCVKGERITAASDRMACVVDPMTCASEADARAGELSIGASASGAGVPFSGGSFNFPEAIAGESDLCAGLDAGDESSIDLCVTSERLTAAGEVVAFSRDPMICACGADAREGEL